MTHVCTRCGTVGSPTILTPTLVLVLLGFAGLAVALIERVMGRAGGWDEHWFAAGLIIAGAVWPRGCPRCQASALVPVDTPAGQRITGQR